MARLGDAWPGPKASGFAQQDAEVPFPLEVPSRVRPDLAKLADGPLLVQDSQWWAWTARKREAVCAGKAPLFDHRLGETQWQDLAGAVAHALQAFVPNGPVDARGHFPWLGGVHADDARAFFCALTMSIQEDFALMLPDADSHLQACLLSVAFPSGWDPKQKLGMALRGIHAPVADNEALHRGTAAMEQAMVSKGPFVRHVWTLAGNDALKRAAGEDTLANAKTVRDLWYRCERQVTVPLGGLGCLFLIRVFVAPLTQVLQAPGRMRRMQDALLSMSSQMLDYKGIRRAAQIVLEFRDV